MTDTPDTPAVLERDWQRVTLTLTYLDDGETRTLPVTFDRAELEATERERQARGAPTEEAIARAQQFTLTPSEFRESILQTATNMVQAPIKIPGERPHEIRYLPPANVLGVVVSVDNLSTGIVIPDA